MTPEIQTIRDYLMDPMMYAGPDRSLEALDALKAKLERSREALEFLKYLNVSANEQGWDIEQWKGAA